ncbi:hypothetical protein GCM10022237_23280 [Nocardioides ginsengisoli]|uniref:DUF2207 domain-containing protein n=1 Tax=Nocardioides ginsengisoli TaxID=363868 RepID=A0ABW3W5I3_9ACTN
MVDRRELEQRNDAIHAEHRAAVARGEERVLRLTRTGELHSYRPDEIGLGPVTAGIQVTSWWGLAILTAFFVAMFVASWLVVLVPVARGGSPAWGGLAMTALSAPLGIFTAHLSREQYRARRTRQARGLPEPSDYPVPDRWYDHEAAAALLARARTPHPRADRWRKRPWWWVLLRAALSVALALGLIGILTEPGDESSTDGLWFAGVGLLLTIALPVVLAARRVRIRSEV